MNWEGFARRFNQLLSLEIGSFGASPKGKRPGAGVLRARERLAQHRREQRARLKDALYPVETRQQARSYALRGR